MRLSPDHRLATFEAVRPPFSSRPAIETIPSKRDRAMLAVLPGCGLRRAELVFMHALVKLNVDNNIEKRTVNRQPSTVVLNETQLPEFVPEETGP